jgi:hypothetical protein
MNQYRVSKKNLHAFPNHCPSYSYREGVTKKARNFVSERMSLSFRVQYLIANQERSACLSSKREVLGAKTQADTQSGQQKALPNEGKGFGFES